MAEMTTAIFLEILHEELVKGGDRREIEQRVKERIKAITAIRNGEGRAE